MPLSLEHFKMLSAKASSLERGTGGTPEISFHEVADLLAKVEYPVSIYARYVYAKQRGLSKALVNLLVDKLKPKDLDITPKYYLQIAELAIRATEADYSLTNAQKAFAIGMPWWIRKHEHLYQKALSLLDEWDFELRVAIKGWNEEHLMG
jgi:hypothetical protein